MRWPIDERKQTGEALHLRRRRLSQRRGDEQKRRLFFERMEDRVLLTTVSVQATTPSAYEQTLTPGTFTVTRADGDTSQNLMVFYAVTGTAVAGTNYQYLGGTINILPGQSTAQINVTPINDNASGPNRSVVMTLSMGCCGGGAYTIGSPSSATLTIVEATVATPTIQLVDGSATLTNGGSDAFGTTSIGTPVSKTLTVRNIGANTLTVSSLSLPSGFASSSTLPMSIAPGSFGTLVVNLTAQAAGSYSGLMSLATNDTANNPFNLNISGTVNATAGFMELLDGATTVAKGGSDAFGTTTVGAPIAKTFTVHNTGTTQLIVSSVTLATGFSTSTTFPLYTSPGGTSQFIVSLSAQTPGSYNGQMSLSTNDSANNPFGVTISGTVNAAGSTVTAISPSSGSTMGGTSVVIAGTGFTGVSSVSFGGVAAYSFTVNSPNSLTAIAPSHAMGTVYVTVTTSAGTSATGPQTQFTYGAAAPTISYVSPSTGPSAGGTSVVINGGNFVGVTGVSFGGVAASSYTVTSSNSITAVSPAHAAGLVHIVVTTASGSSMTMPQDQFTYLAPPPTLTSVSPRFGSADGGTSVTISGNDFVSVSSVRFGNTWATSFTINSPNSITAIAPAHAVGSVDITVVTSSGTSTVNAAVDRFTYTAPPPAITGMSPATGGTTGGQSVTISGSNFVNVVGISFGGMPASSFTVVSPTSLTAIAPAHAAGTVAVRITTLSGTSPVDPAHDSFTYTTSSSSGPLTVTRPADQISVEGASVSLAVSATSSNPGAFTYALVGQLEGLSIDLSGLICGTISHGAADVNRGQYAITVTVTDGGNYSASQTFSWLVTDVYRQPVITNPGSKTSAEGSPVTLAVTASNPEGNTLTYSASGLPGGLSIDPATGVISGTIDCNAANSSDGLYRTMLYVSDGEGGTDAETFEWRVTDTPRGPVMDTVGAQAIAEGTAVSIQVAANSPDDRALAYAATGLPTGLSVDIHSGLISGTVDYSTAQLMMSYRTVVVSVSDDREMTTSLSFLLTIADTPQAPLLSNPGGQANREGDIVSLAIAASSLEGGTLVYGATNLPLGLNINPNTGLITGTLTYAASDSRSADANVTVTVTDNKGSFTQETFPWAVADVTGLLSIADPGTIESAEGDAISFQTQIANPNGHAFARSVTGLPAGLSMSATGLITGTILYDAAETNSGSYTVTLSATDDQDQTASLSFLWTVSDTNRPPTITNPGGKTGSEGETVDLTITATDPEGGAVTFATTGLPAGLAIDAQTGQISGTIDYVAADASGGSCQVTVTATDAQGVAASLSFTWSVTDVNRAPTLAPLGSRTQAEGTSVSLALSASDADDDVLSFSASGLPRGLSIDAATGMISGKIGYSAAQFSGGVHTVSITVSDGQGGSATGSFDWIVTNASHATETSGEGDAVSLMVRPIDPGSATLTYAATGLPAGLAIDAQIGLISGTIAHTAAETGGGNYTVSVTASDGQSVSATETFGWTVVNTNRLPTIVDPGAQTGQEGGVVSLSVVASDADADTISFSAGSLPSGLSINASTGIISGTLGYAAADVPGGAWSTTVTATDSHGGSSNVTFTWTVTDTNRAPTLTAPSAQTAAEGSAVSLAVVAQDPDANPLQFLAVGLPAGLTIDSATGVISGTIDYNAAQESGGQYTVMVVAIDGRGGIASERFNWAVTNAARPTLSDPEGAAIELRVLPIDPTGKHLTYTATGLPSGLSINKASGWITGTLAYSAAETSGGSFQVTVTAVDGGSHQSLSETFVWNVTNVNRAPQIPTIGTRRSSEGDVISLTLNASDPEGGAVSYVATGLPAGLSVNATSGLISGVVDFAAAGADANPYAVTVTATDGQENATSQVFNWLVTDTARPPAVPNPGAQTNAEGDVVSLGLAADNPDGGTLTYFASGLPGGLSVDADTGLLSGTIDYNAAAISSGIYSVTVTAFSNTGQSNSQTFSWTVSNTIRPMTMVNPGTQAGAEGDGCTLAIQVDDPDGGTLTFVAAGLPAGLSIDAATGLINGNVDYSAAETSGGLYNVTITATDSLNRTASQTFVWTVANTHQNPTITDPGTQQHQEGDTVNLAIFAESPEGDALTYSATGLPEGLSIGSADGLISGKLAYTAAQTSSGHYSVTVTATDAHNGSASLTFTWIVTDVAEPLSMVNPGSRTSMAGASMSFQVQVTGPANHPWTYSATGLPLGMSINGQSGVVSGTVESAAAGSSQGNYSITVTATNNLGQTASEKFIWTINDTSTVVITNPGSHVDTEEDSVLLSLVVSNPQNTPLTFTATGLPAGLGLNSSTGQISGVISQGAADAQNGVYQVEVTASNGSTTVASQSFVWTVEQKVRSPLVSPPAAQTTAEGATVSLQIVATDPEGTSLVYSATGMPAGLTIDAATGLITGKPLYSAAEVSEGSYSVTVSAENARGAVGSAVFTWTVTNIVQPPTVFSPGPQTSAEGDSVWLRIDGGHSEDRSITYSASGLPAGLSIDAHTGLVSGRVGYANAGPSATDHDVTVTVTDDHGVSSSASFVWTITDNQGPPVIDQPGAHQNKEGETVSLSLSAADPAGTVLTYSAAGLPAGLNIDSNTGQITGTISHDAVASGAQSFAVTVTVTNGQAVSSSSPFVWNVLDVNRAPIVAATSAQSSAEGQAVNLAISASDADGDTLHYSALGLPLGLSIDGNTGVISGTPGYTNADMNGGQYAVKVRVFDGRGQASTQEFTWTVSNGLLPPTVNQPGDQSGTEGQDIWLQVTAQDPLGRPLTFSAVGLPGGLTINSGTGLISGTLDYANAQDSGGSHNVVVSAVNDQGQTANVSFTWSVTDTHRSPAINDPGTQYDAEGDSVSLALAADNPEQVVLSYSATGLPAGLSINAATGQISGTIGYNAALSTGSGSYAVTVTAMDPSGVFADRTFNWIVANGSPPPTVTNPGSAASAEGNSVTVAITASDADGNLLTYSATGLPAGLSINPVSGVISGTVNYTDAETSNGVYNVTVSASTADGSIGSQTFTWTVTNTPVTPQLTNPGSQTSRAGAQVAYQVQSSNPANRPLTYSATGLPAGLNINAQSGLIGGTISSSASGGYTITFAVQDDQGHSSTQTFTWTVGSVNRAPAATDQALWTYQGSAATFALVGQDADLDVVTYQLVTAPAHGTVTLSGGTATYTPAVGYVGDDSFTFCTNDGVASSSAATVSVTVAAIPVVTISSVVPASSSGSSGQSSYPGGPPMIPPPGNSGGSLGSITDDPMVAYAEPLPFAMGMSYGNGAIFQTVPGMPTPSTLTGQSLQSYAPTSNTAAPRGGSLSASLQGSSTAADGSSDVLQASSSVDYVVSSSTSDNGDWSLTENVAVTFSFEVDHTAPESSPSSVQQSGSSLQALQVTSQGNTVTYVLTHSGSLTYTYHVTGGGTVNGAGGSTTTTSYDYFDSITVAYVNTQTITVTTYTDGTHSSTDNFATVRTYTRTFDYSDRFSSAFTTSTSTTATTTSLWNSFRDKGGDTWVSVSEIDMATDTAGTRSGTQTDTLIGGGGDQYEGKNGYDSLTVSGFSSGTSGYGGFSTSTAIDTASNSYSGSDSYGYGSKSQRTYHSDGTTTGGSTSKLSGGGSDTYGSSDGHQRSSASFFGTGSGGASFDENTWGIGGQDSYQYWSVGATTTYANGTQSSATASGVVASGSDLYVATSTHSNVFTSVGTTSGGLSSSYSGFAVVGNDGYTTISLTGETVYTNGTKDVTSGSTVGTAGGDVYSVTNNNCSSSSSSDGNGGGSSSYSYSNGGMTGNDSYVYASVATNGSYANGTSSHYSWTLGSGGGDDKFETHAGHGSTFISVTAFGGGTDRDSKSKDDVTGNDSYGYVSESTSVTNTDGTHWSSNSSVATGKSHAAYTFESSSREDITTVSVTGSASANPTVNVQGVNVSGRIAGGGSLSTRHDKAWISGGGASDSTAKTESGSGTDVNGTYSSSSTTILTHTDGGTYSGGSEHRATADSVSASGSGAGGLAWGVVPVGLSGSASISVSSSREDWGTTYQGTSGSAGLSTSYSTTTSSGMPYGGTTTSGSFVGESSSGWESSEEWGSARSISAGLSFSGTLNGATSTGHISSSITGMSASGQSSYVSSPSATSRLTPAARRSRAAVSLPKGELVSTQSGQPAHRWDSASAPR
ncbi:MAG: putative Ig domain-containing protein [Pirellulaceae bacterium]